jgi:hypothetical protein
MLKILEHPLKNPSFANFFDMLITKKINLREIPFAFFLCHLKYDDTPFFTNEIFGHTFGVDERTIRTWLVNLEKAKYIERIFVDNVRYIKWLK